MGSGAFLGTTPPRADAGDDTRIGPSTAANSTEFGRLRGTALEPHPRAYGLYAERSKSEVERREATPKEDETVLLRRGPGLLMRTLALFNWRWLAAAVGVALIIAVGVLVYAPSLRPSYLASFVSGIWPGSGQTSNQSTAPAQRTVIQAEPLPAFSPSQRAPLPPLALPPPRAAPAVREVTIDVPLTEVKGHAVSPENDAKVSASVTPAPTRVSVQSSATVAATKGSEGEAACFAGVAALGLCPSEPGSAQPATQVSSSTETARAPPKEQTSGRCKEAAVALGLCAQ